MKKVIIFGDQDMAELAHYYLTTDANREVECFTVHQQFITKNSCCGSPIVPFEELSKKYPTDQFCLFAPIYSKEMNQFRERVYKEIKQMGYECISYVSSKAHTWNSEIGENCCIFEGCNIQPFCKVGNNVVIWSFSHIGHHSKVADNVFISGNVVIAGHNDIEQYCFLGSNCTTREFTTIPEGSFIGQDASVTTNPTEPWGVWVGVPAKYLKSSKGIM